MDAIYDKLTAIFREVFDDPEIEIKPESTADDIEEWDSLTHMNLILMIELKFDIEFHQREVMGFQNVGDMAACIQKKLGNRHLIRIFDIHFGDFLRNYQ